MSHSRPLFVFTVALCLFALAVASNPARAQSAAAKPPAKPAIVVYAASSLQESLDRVAAAWKRRSGQSVKISYAASSALANQIEQGAPADLYFPADEAWMDHLEIRRQIEPDTRINLLSNRLVMIAPAADGGSMLALTAEGLNAALGQGRLAVAETASVPAGRYAKESLTTLGLWPTVVGRLAEADNVRLALAYVARAESPLGVVYATDAAAEPRVRVVAHLPASSHARIVYPVARLRDADPQLSREFLRFLSGEEARKIFEQAGFVVL